MAELIVEETPAGDPFVSAGRERATTREERTIELHEKYGAFFLRIGTDFWHVPSQDSRRYYEVHYPVGEGETESCDCEDFEHRGQYTGRPCKHILACGIAYAKRQGKVSVADA